MTPNRIKMTKKLKARKYLKMTRTNKMIREMIRRKNPYSVLIVTGCHVVSALASAWAQVHSSTLRDIRSMALQALVFSDPESLSYS